MPPYTVVLKKSLKLFLGPRSGLCGCFSVEETVLGITWPEKRQSWKAGMMSPPQSPVRKLLALCMECWLSRRGAPDGQVTSAFPRALQRSRCRILIPDKLYFILFHFVYFFFLFMAAPAAYGHSQARGQFRAAVAGRHHNHSNAGSELHLQPTLQLAACTGSLPTE